MPEAIQTYFKEMFSGPNQYILVVIPVVCVVFILSKVIRGSQSKKTSANFLAQHPDAAKVYLKFSALTSGSITILSVNDQPAVQFTEGSKHAFFLLPGDNSIKFQYRWTRPGVMHKTVTTVMDSLQASLSPEANAIYTMDFNRKTETCTFTKEQT